MAKASKKTQATTATTADVQAPVAVESEAQTTTTMEPVQLTIADLQLLGRVVDLASRRGAFQAAELSQVGDAYNKLASFLNYVESVQKNEKADADAAAQTEETPVA